MRAKKDKPFASGNIEVREYLVVYRDAESIFGCIATHNICPTLLLSFVVRFVL